MLEGFSAGDVMLADALYCNYFLIATLMGAGVDVLRAQIPIGFGDFVIVVAVNVNKRPRARRDQFSRRLVR